MLCLAVVLAIQASIFQVSQAVGDATVNAGGPPSCDIKDLGCIANEVKAALSVNHTTFKSEYQQFAEMIAPVLLLAHGGNFEVCIQGLSCSCQRWIACLKSWCPSYLGALHDWLCPCWVLCCMAKRTAPLHSS